MTFSRGWLARGWPAGFFALAAVLQPAMAAAASRAFAAPRVLHMRPSAHSIQASHRNFAGPRARPHRRLVSGTFLGGWPYAWSEAVANEEPAAVADANGVPFAVPVLYAPPPVAPPCSPPRLIDIVPPRPGRALPHIVYGTPRLCPN